MGKGNGTGWVFAGVTQWRGGGQTAAAEDSLGGVFRMRQDGGGAWEHLRNGLPDSCQVLCLTADPTREGVVYAGTQDGPYRTTDSGESWTRLGLAAGLPVFSITLHPDDPRVVFAGSSPIAIHRSDDSGATWRKLSSEAVPDRVNTGAFADRVMRIAVDPLRPAEMYAAAEINGVARSVDGGETWVDCSESLAGLASREELRNRDLSPSESEGLLDAHAICVSKARPGAAIVANRMGLFRTSDGGRSWADLGTRKFSPRMSYGRDIRVSPQDPRTLYACLSIAAHSKAGSLWRSTDLGENWTRFDRGVDPQSTMMAVAAHPHDGKVVYCNTRRGQVFGTHDGGETWDEHRMPEQCRSVMALACA